MNKLRLFFLSRRSWTLPYLIFSIIFVIVPLLLIVVMHLPMMQVV